MRKEELFIICLATALLSCSDNSSDPISEGSDAAGFIIVSIWLGWKISNDNYK